MRTLTAETAEEDDGACVRRDLNGDANPKVEEQRPWAVASMENTSEVRRRRQKRWAGREKGVGVMSFRLLACKS